LVLKSNLTGEKVLSWYCGCNALRRLGTYARQSVLLRCENWNTKSIMEFKIIYAQEKKIGAYGFL
jgi:hypothetical protein